jgi:hypothetical protein
MQPIDDFIPRDLPLNIQEILDKYSNWLDEIINFGSNVILWDTENVKGQEEFLPPILFLRNLLEYVDACSILIKKSSIEPCNSILRTILENFLSIEYLLLEKTEQRALSFLVWNTFENRKLLLSMDGKSDSSIRLQSAFKKDKLFKDAPIFTLPNAAKKIKNNEELLKSEKYKQVVKEYYRTKEKLKKTPNWYNLFDGPINIEKLADKLGYNAYYEILYRTLSSSTHGTAIIQGKIKRNDYKGIDIFQIRLSNGAKNTTSFCVTLTTSLFRTYILKRIPSKKDDFDTWIKTILPIFNELGTK